MKGTTDPAIFDEDAVRRTIHELIVELAPSQSAPALLPQHQLVADLAYTSLALMELAFTLEDEFMLNQIDEERALKIVSAGDVEKHVLDELRRKARLKR